MNERTELVLGGEAVNRLANSRVIAFGLGGVGGACIEALARSGVGGLTLIDFDTISASNINRQIIALNSTIGELKTEAFKKRIMDINPKCAVIINNVRITPENIGDFDFTEYDYAIDAIDTISAKLAIIEACVLANVPIVSSMGTGNKLDATRFKISDIYETSVCPLARVMRRELNKRGVKKLEVLWSDEQPISNSRPPGSVSFVPPVAGMLIAGHVIKRLIGS